MLVFIVPIKSAQVSDSWDCVSKLFERCIRSICNQTTSEFRVVIVCHEKPKIEFTHPHIIYTQVTFPIPTWEVDTDLESRDKDKARKIWTGLIQAEQFHPTHVMVVDADDCVSRRLAEFTKQNSDRNGWYIERGYEYSDQSNFIFLRKRNFYKKCGTANIIKYSLLQSWKGTLFDDIQWDFFHHGRMNTFLEKQGFPLEELPFEGAVYITENGENIYSQTKYFLKKKGEIKEIVLFFSRKLFKRVLSKVKSESICKEFSI